MNTYVRFHSNSYMSVFCFYECENIWMKGNQGYNEKGSEGLLLVWPIISNRL